VVIAGTSVAVQQDGLSACTFGITPDRTSFAGDGGTGTVAVTAAAHCSWQATAGAAWLTVTSGAAGSGSGNVAYKVDANPTPLERAGTLLVAGLTFAITQDGDPSSCSYEVGPVALSICMAWTTDLVSAITTQEGCPWSATSAAGWITVNDGASGTGSGTIRLRGTDNYDAPRTGIVEVRWPAATAGQNVRVDQAGCTYAVTQSAFTLSAAGGTGRFDVLQQSDPISCGGPLQNGCVWSAVSQVPWITITSSMPRAGDEPVNFTVAANTTGAVRTGTITVRDRVVTVTQMAGS
jgi:hypothetical protein